jgi:hypothetical protein
MKPNFASVIQSLNFIQIKKQVIRFFLNELSVTIRAWASGTVNDQTKRRARSSLFSKYFSRISSQASTGKINTFHSGIRQSVPQGPAAGAARDQTTHVPGAWGQVIKAATMSCAAAINAAPCSAVRTPSSTRSYT